jgi:putative DNA primase/helicase
VNVETIPLELRERRQWVTWKFEQRDGKLTKPPLRPDASNYASADDPTTWGSFEEALATVEQGKARGVGFVFTADDPYVGVDLDACRKAEAQLEPDAAAIILRLDSYTEWSVSEKGVHVLLRGRLPGPRRRKGRFEAYESGRYFAMTGEIVRGCPETIEERQAELEQVYKAVFPPEPETTIELSRRRDTLGLDDQELLERARKAKNGAGFETLWRGDLNGYGSHSEADLALAGLIAFWTGPDAGRIDSLFRRSGLMREKWDTRRGESTYGAQTIARALEGRSDFYSPQPRPVLAPSSPPGPSETTSPLAPYPVGGEVVGDLAPQPRPEVPWERVDVAAAAAHPPTPPEVGRLFYRGRLHVVSGEFESGKTWLLLAAVSEELRAGRGVVWINTDAMSAAEMYERLHALGVADGAIERSFYFVEPDSLLEETATVQLLEFVTSSKGRLVVGDALNSLLALHGVKTNLSEEIEGFLRRWQPFAKAGCAVVFPDHVVKAKEERGAYAYGSERKVTGTQVHLGLKAFPKIRRGERGTVKILVHRDRVGFLHHNPPGMFVLDSDAETGACRFWFEQDLSRTADGFRPTGLMEKVSHYIEGLILDPPPRTQIESEVTGKRDYIRHAVDVLLEEGYAEEIAGKHGARLVQSLSPYREDDDRAEVEP